jgi:CTP synthase
LQPWTDLVEKIRHPLDEVNIGIVGKYVGYQDSYKSLTEALFHGGIARRVKVNVSWVEAEGLEGDACEEQLRGLDGILVPGGFGRRGIPGMLKGIEYARTRKVPYFGICLGMQCAVIEYARNVCGLAGADSSEFDPSTPHRVIYKLRELRGIDDLGGTMRLGAWTARLKPGSFAHQAYGSLEISERHRHRYEFNREYRRNPGGQRIAIDRDDARQHLCGDCGNSRPSLVPGLPVPSGIQVPAPGAASALHRVCAAAHEYRRGCGRSRRAQRPGKAHPGLFP